MYPVINLSLKSGKQPDFELAYKALAGEIADEYARHFYVCQNNALLPNEKEQFIRILEQKGDRAEYNKSLLFLSRCLEKYYGRKVIILIDEYDVPLENAFMEDFYDEMTGFIRSLFESALKTNRSLEFAVITGCLRISRESIFTGMDNLWNFLFFTGYFRVVREWMDDNDMHMIELTLPNREVKSIFRTKILSWFDEKMKEKNRTRLFQAVVDCNVPVVEEEITTMLLETIRFHDAYESFYHGFLTGVLSGMKGYIVRSNREGGYGRSDLFIIPVTRRKAAFVVEFKIARNIREMETKAEEAILQIHDREYGKELNQIGYDIIHKYGIAFCGKDCHVLFEE